MAAEQRGMALVTVLFLLALLLALALVLTDKVLQSTRGLARDSLRERTFWAASAGIEWARLELAEHYRATGNWQDLLPAMADTYAATPFRTLVVDAIPVELYVRDNPDGDDDPQRDNDLKVLVLARARLGRGPEILVESLCGFASPAFMANTTPSGRSAGGSPEFSSLVAEPIESFQITD